LPEIPLKEFEVWSLKFGVWSAYELQTSNSKLTTESSKKAGKSRVFKPDSQAVPDIIFRKTFFLPLFEIKSCSTFAASFQ